MKTRLALVSLLGVLALPLPALAQHDATHETLGRVSFPTSCDPKVQPEFERGVAMLHWYWFGTAGRTFRAILEKDPNCAMAYWGIAVDLLGNTLSGPPAPKDAQAAWELLEKARAARAPTEREQGWIEALRGYYRGHDSIPLETRLRTYNAAMAKLAARYPEDFEAQVFYALTLQASAPSADLAYANQLKSAHMLEKLYEQNPQHPGVSHFIIHAYDYAPLAQDGIPAARRYAGIAPAVPHARHMPSHIYSMVGLWEDSIASNLSSLEIQPDYYHAADFTVYAHLQLGQDVKAGRDDSQGHGHAAARGSPAVVGQLHRACGDAGALRARARRLGRRRSAAGQCRLRATAGRRRDALRPWSRHGPQRQCRRSEARDRRTARAAARAAVVWSNVLGRSHGRADPRGLRVGGARRRRARSGRER